MPFIKLPFSRIFKPFFALPLFCFSLHAQYYYTVSPLKDSIVKANGISIINVDETLISRKDVTMTYRTVFHYDRDGRNTFSYKVEDSIKHRRIVHSNYSTFPNASPYGTANNFTWYKYDHSKVIEYYDNGRAKATYYFKGNGKARNISTYTYRDSMMERMNLYNGRHKLKKYYSYVYEGKKLKQTTLYNAKGKSIKFWDYSCDDLGKTSQSSKDSVVICTEKSYLADGSVVSSTNSFNYKGEPVKYVEYKNSLGLLTKYMVYTGKNEILTYQYLNQYDSSHLVSTYVKNTDSKGRIYSARMYAYNKADQLVSHDDSIYNSKKPKITNYTFTYDVNGLLNTKKGYSKGRVKMIAYYRYLYWLKD